MYPKFSDRIGITRPNPIQLDSMNLSLRNSLWNHILRYVFIGHPDMQKKRAKLIAQYFFKVPIDEVPDNGYGAQLWLKQIFFNEKFYWWTIYNLIEFLAQNRTIIEGHILDDYISAANSVLEEEISGYRFIEGFISPITNSSEIDSIVNAIEISRAYNLYGAEKHLNTSLELLSKKPNPDYRNSIKESISAIESLVKQITNEESGGLDKALNILDEKVKFHGAFKSGLLSLYGYTSDEDGIRHAILEETEVGFDEAKFMLVTCSALVNLIIAKASKSGILPST